MATFRITEKSKADYVQVQTSPCHPTTAAATVMPIQQTTIAMIIIAIPMGSCC